MCENVAYLYVNHKLLDDVHAGGNSREVTQCDAFHVEYDHVTIDDTVFRYSDVIERVERFYRLLEYESRWIEFSKSVKENTVAFWSALG